MYYLKHPQHGNRHVQSLDECQRLMQQGWVRWPRTKEQKEGIEKPSNTLKLKVR